MSQSILSHQLKNGLALVAEPMDSLESVAFSFLVPAGGIYDPPDKAGLANLTCEMALRGAGPRDDRQFINDLDNLGVEHGESVSATHASYGGSTLADNLQPALAIYADLLRRPHLPADKLEAGRQVAVQEVRSVEDDPAARLMQELRSHHFPDPLGRPPHGTLPGLAAIDIADVRGCFQALYQPQGTILSVAGRFDWQRLCEQVEELFGDWQAGSSPEVSSTPPKTRCQHLASETAQTHIGIAYDSVPYRHEDFYVASATVGVLSSGMSARLFTEVREKRGLCYAVYATYHSTYDLGSVMCYAGTTAERAQETLDVTLGELRRLAEGIEESELQRLKARVKSGLIMQQESSAARASAIARDWYHLHGVRTLDEVAAIVDGLTGQRINAYLEEHPPRDFTIVTLGPQPLESAAAAPPGES